MSESTAEVAHQLDRSARIVAFATLGVLGTTQDIARRLMGNVEGADPELVAEETLCLVATATARAAQVGLRDNPEVAEIASTTLMELPYTYRDYLIGGAIIAEEDPSILEASEEVYERLERKQSFYTAHLPPEEFPGARLLADKMELWMGRVSPPQLPESPQDRLEKLNLVPLVLTHLKLVLAFGRRGGVG